MRRILATMGGTEVGWSRHNDEGTFRDYEAEADRLVESARKFNLETIKFTNDYYKSLPLYEENKEMMNKVSFGFNVKSIGLSEAFKQMDDGDIVLFADSNHIVDKDPSIFYEYADENGVFIHDHIWIQYKNKHWTRRDTFVNMNCDSERYWESLQMQCNIVGFKKSDVTQKFIDEYLACCLNPKIMFGESKYPNFDGFREHRHDQSIFSILTEKYEFPFINRTKNVWAEYVIPEIDTLTPEHPVDNSYRRDTDRLDIR